MYTDSYFARFNLPEDVDAALSKCQYLAFVETKEELDEMVRTLREPYGRVATMYFLEERPVADIARLLGRPPATVQNQLFRAKAILRKQITERRQE